MSTLSIVFRVDASDIIGTGHVMRCLTLAEALHKLGASIQFITRMHSGNMAEQIKSKGFELYGLSAPSSIGLQYNGVGYERWLGGTQEYDVEETVEALNNSIVDWLIIDHYAIDYNWEKQLKSHTKKIMVIDDLANRKHDCDLLLDQNYTNYKGRYNDLLKPDTIKLLGPKYALLRKEFIENKNINKQNITIKRIFVFFGGTDLNNITKLALKALTQPKLKHLLVDVVIGFANPYKTELRIEIEQYPNMKLYTQVNNIAELMLKADLALGAGGVTTWERMALGLPSLVITTAENQVASTKDLDKDGYIKWLGNADHMEEQIIYNALQDAINNSNQLQEQSRKCQSLINGEGVQIVSKLLTKGPDPETLSVRKAKLSDLSLYWCWANDSEVRKNAFNEDAIEWQEHKEWFDKRLNDSNSILLLIESDFGAIGQVRFDRIDSHYTISYSLAKQFRGLGLAASVLSKAIEYVRIKKVFTLVGEIKENNKASRKVFEKLGFSEFASTRKDVKCFQLQLYPTIKYRMTSELKVDNQTIKKPNS